MTWKDLPNWLRYGIYVAIAYPIILYTAIFIGGIFESPYNLLTAILFYIILFLSLPSILVIEVLRVPGSGYVIGTISSIITGFVIGAIAGLFKSDNKYLKKTNKETKKIISVYGIISLIFGVAGILVYRFDFGFIIPLFAILLSFIQRKRSPSWTATIGLILGIIGLILGIASLFF